MKPRLSKQLAHLTDWIVAISDGYLSSGLRPKGWPRNTCSASKTWPRAVYEVIHRVIRKLLSASRRRTPTVTIGG